MIERATIEKLHPAGRRSLVVWELTGRTGMLPTYLSRPSAIIAAIVGADRLAASCRVTLGGQPLSRSYAGFAHRRDARRDRRARRRDVDRGRQFLRSARLVPLSDPEDHLPLGVPACCSASATARRSPSSRSAVFFPGVHRLAPRRALGQSRCCVWSARNMGARPATVFFRVMLPAAAPQLFAGLRVGLAHLLRAPVRGRADRRASGLGLHDRRGRGSGALRPDVRRHRRASPCSASSATGILMAVRRRVLRGQMIGTQEQVPCDDRPRLPQVRGFIARWYSIPLLLAIWQVSVASGLVDLAAAARPRPRCGIALVDGDRQRRARVTTPA